MVLSGAWIGAGVLVCGAVVCALLARILRSRHSSVPITGWVMLGGAVAGALLGPTIFGRLAPGPYEQWFVGGASERAQREQVIRRHDADVVAATHAQSDLAQLEQWKVEHERELSVATHAWRDAQWKHQAPLRALALFVAGCVLLFGGSHSIRRGDERQGLLSPLTIGFWAAALPGGLAYAAMTGLWGIAPAQAALTAAALAIGPWMLTPMDRAAADLAEFGGARMVQTAGRIATILAIIAAIWGLWSARSIEGLLMGVALLALPLGWLFRAPLRAMEPLVNFIVLPTLAAATMIKVELIVDFAFWPLVVILLISDDGRWLGAFCGAMLLGGRRTLRTMRLVVGSISAAVTQLAVIAIAAHAWEVPRQIVLPVVLGSLLIEFTADTRRKLVQRLTQVEDEFPDHVEP